MECWSTNSISYSMAIKNADVAQYKDLKQSCHIY